MLRYIGIYGALGGALVVGFISATFMLGATNHTHSVWFGYLVMLIGLSLIFVGVKRYRDVECGGIIRFGRALLVGLGMAAVAGVVYALGWEIYLRATGYDFMADYTASTLRGMRAHGASAAAIAAKTAELQELGRRYSNPLFRVPMTFVEIFPPAVLVALVTAAIIRNERVLPARARPVEVAH